ncbi:uncharacterized protein [Rutidosis leptorrhynchoides]|uniref:uncharacterized protein n=1 Tax=Rutidosis leptorrhynchoides TaxID=125765 RepID=UPI003A995539
MGLTVTKKKRMQKSLEDLMTFNTDSWVLCGDFNESAFAQNGSILDGVIVVNEVIGDGIWNRVEKPDGIMFSPNNGIDSDNGSPTLDFKLESELRQDDLLSPILFIIASEGLYMLFKSAYKSALFKGVEVGKDTIYISHLHYDTIITGDGSNRNIQRLQLLKDFKMF